LDLKASQTADHESVFFMTGLIAELNEKVKWADVVLMEAKLQPEKASPA